MVEKTKKIKIEVPENLVKEFKSEKRLSIFGLLKDWRINPQELKDELREE